MLAKSTSTMAFPILKQTPQSLGFFDRNDCGGDDGLSSLTNLVDISSVTNKSNILDTRQALSSLLQRLFGQRPQVLQVRRSQGFQGRSVGGPYGKSEGVLLGLDVELLQETEISV